MSEEKMNKMHPRDCKCERCSAMVNIMWAEMTIRAICPKCHLPVDHTDRIHERTSWSPSVYCQRCGGFVGIFEVIVGDIGVTLATEQPAATEEA